MKKVFIFILAFNLSHSQNEKDKLCFDTIDYYRLIENENNTNKELDEIIQGKIFTDFKANYIEKLLNKDTFRTIKLKKEDIKYFKNKILIDSKCDFETVGSCLPVYKDFLLLKEKNQIVTVIYISLHCQEVLFYNEKGLYFFECFNENEKNSLLIKILKNYN